jgi:DedD protein
MEEGSKRRLVGTAVVVLLLVIFLPMLLEEEPRNPVSDEELEIPPSPEFKKDFDPALSEPAAETFAVPSAPELPPAEPYREDPVASEPPAPAQVPTSTPEPAQEEPAPAPVVKTEPKPAPEPEPAAMPQKPVSNGASWVIQVASLSQPERAATLERELRAKGFPAFIEKAVVGGKTYHRVRVGPEISRREIEAMAASVRDKTGHKGQIQAYP